MTLAPSGWYADPEGGDALRYWDGSVWTDHRAPRTTPPGYTAEVTPYVGANPVRAVRTALARATNFRGRASLGEYWWFLAFYVSGAVAVLVLGALLTANADAEAKELVSGVSSLLILVGLWPLIAVAARRMHDGGRSAWWLLIGLVPIAGLAVHIWMLTVSKGVNKWGAPAVRPDPGPA
ncbi:MAG: DUF805 domain-containing protein [Nocardioides sp.]|nr:DUF805 domain-containing protein [Nocardioides sp.]